ncbi:MAG TPA: hypothetical protein VHX87_06355 [Galbitalea sp.]|jgi:hypothetical protein|nr:hypothetical protein [Galbitalea sp.]
MRNIRPHVRRARLIAAAIITALGLVLVPFAAETAQAGAPLNLQVNWDLYNYQFGGGVPFFSQNSYIADQAAAAAKAHADCPNVCVYLAPALPGSPGTYVQYTVNATNARGFVLNLATQLENKGGAALLNPAYNWGAVGTYTKGDVTWADLILVQYSADPPEKVQLGPTTIYGSATVGSLLQISTTVPPYATPTYQWKDNGATIPGAMNPTYVVGAGDLGHNITVTITATADGLNPGTDTSNALGPIGLGLIFHPPVVHIDGSQHVGHSLRVDCGQFVGPRLTCSYQWYRGGSAVRGAIDPTYALTSADQGHTINVHVIVVSAAPGYETLELRSDSHAHIGAALTPTS